jgi:hypothetical protein
MSEAAIALATSAFWSVRRLLVSAINHARHVSSDMNTVGSNGVMSARVVVDGI